LFKVSDATGTLVTTLVASGKEIKKSNLDSEDVFVLDAGTKVFVWVGKGATPQGIIYFNIY
jgi:gelsolin